jgi:hypothetical protein
MSDATDRLAVIKKNYDDASNNEAMDISGAKSQEDIDAIQSNVERARVAYYGAVAEMLSNSGQDVEDAYNDAINAQKAIADARKKAASIAELIGKLANATDKATTLLNKAKQ